MYMLVACFERKTRASNEGVLVPLAKQSVRSVAGAAGQASERCRASPPCPSDRGTGAPWASTERGFRILQPP